MARKCLFCGSPANSKEHAFPDWLSDLVPGEGQLQHKRERSGGAETLWHNEGFDIQVRQVCKKCNETWMSALEGRSKELVTDFVLGTRTAALSHGEQTKLSTWGFKTGVMLALAYPVAERFVPLDHYIWLREELKPPNGITMWIAGLLPEIEGEPRLQVGWTRPERLDFRRASTGAVDAHGYRLSFSVIRLIFQIVWDPYGGKFERPREYRDVWTRIRPISKGDWPPKRWIAQAGLEDVAGGQITSGPQL